MFISRRPLNLRFSSGRFRFLRAAPHVAGSKPTQKGGVRLINHLYSFLHHYPTAPHYFSARQYRTSSPILPSVKHFCRTSQPSNPEPLLFPVRQGLNHDEAFSQNLRGQKLAHKDPSRHRKTSGCSRDSSKRSGWLHWTVKSLVKTERLKTSQVSVPRGPLNRAELFLRPLKIAWVIVLASVRY
jgi:hypothetical protein